MSDNGWTRTGYPWSHEMDQRRPGVPPSPDLTEGGHDTRPVVGRIYGPKGSVLLVVRGGPASVPFGPQVTPITTEREGGVA